MRMNPKTLRISLAMALLALAGCEGKSSKDANAYAGEQKVAGSELSLQEFMTHVIEHNAEEIWKWQATSIDNDGSHDSYPKTDQDWEKAESAALTLVELTKPLEGIGGAQNSEWLKKVAGLRAAAKAAATSAEAKQLDGFVASGEQLNEACLSCHYAFAPHLELPQTKQ